MIQAAFRQGIGVLVRMLPPWAPEFIYANLLRGPLRKLFNSVVLSILPQTVKISEGTVVLNPADPIVSGSLAFGVFEPYETELFKHSVKEGMTVVDMGANIGYYSLIAASRVRKNGRVLAFEPEPANFQILQKTVCTNHLENIETHQLAIANIKGVLKLNLYDSNKGKHSLVKDKTDAKGFTKTIEVRTTDLDSFLKEHQIEKIDVIKMDIEGAESLALKGMQQALSQCSILFMEFTPTSISKIGDDPEEILQQLQNLGFTLYEINEKSKSKRLISNNHAFIRTIPYAHAANLFCSRIGGSR